VRLARVVPLTQRRLIDHGTVHSYGRLPSGALVSITGGRHDALNDQKHRTAAATVVLFLERLRLGVDAPTLARSEELR
jgi:hypothetical protein